MQKGLQRVGRSSRLAVEDAGSERLPECERKALFDGRPCTANPHSSLGARSKMTQGLWCIAFVAHRKVMTSRRVGQ